MTGKFLDRASIPMANRRISTPPSKWIKDGLIQNKDAFNIIAMITLFFSPAKNFVLKESIGRLIYPSFNLFLLAVSRCILAFIISQLIISRFPPTRSQLSIKQSTTLFAQSVATICVLSVPLYLLKCILVLSVFGCPFYIVLNLFFNIYNAYAYSDVETNELLDPNYMFPEPSPRSQRVPSLGLLDPGRRKTRSSTKLATPNRR